MKFQHYISLIKYYSFSRNWWLVFFQCLLASYGGIWLLTEALSFFYKDAELFLATKGVWFLALGLLIAFFLGRPKTVFGYQLKNRDITIETRIADAFEVLGDLIVPTNTTFDTDLDGKIPEAHSIQGGFTRRYYDSEIHHLDLDIDKELDKEDYDYEEPPEKRRGKKRRYPIGTVIQVKKGGRLFYLVANTHINNDGSC